MRRQRNDEQWTARHEAAESAQQGYKALPTDNDLQRLKRRKIRVVAAVRGGMLSLHQALERFNLTLGEFYEWERDVGKDVAHRRQQLRRSKAAHKKTAEYARLAQENSLLKAENKKLREQLNFHLRQPSGQRKNLRMRPRSHGNADRSPE